MADGVVVESGFSGGIGNRVVVQHNARQSTLYAHLSKIAVRKGQTIKQGDNLGAVGATGWATGPHLHFEFRVNGRHQNPLAMVRQSEPVVLAPEMREAFKVVASAQRRLLDSAQILQQALAQTN